ncbi:hypothetical protein L596_022486 [Steinernema carpocapsae]|uniref:Uncharacterized protein n=1 Tax=Steinernema carpocapsae TaxID=34508 RepID=A0A4U5MLW2_STECR|nr:hypothetical protein L596_022486 [Steinernema carpocapsae]
MTRKMIYKNVEFEKDVINKIHLATIPSGIKAYRASFRASSLPCSTFSSSSSSSLRPLFSSSEQSSSMVTAGMIPRPAREDATTLQGAKLMPTEAKTAGDEYCKRIWLWRFFWIRCVGVVVSAFL